jgi:hypothetical protein
MVFFNPCPRQNRQAAKSLRKQVALFWKVLSAGNAAVAPEVLRNSHLARETARLTAYKLFTKPLNGLKTNFVKWPETNPC